jgi:hypothetical protein
MRLSTRVLGAGTARELQMKATAAIVTIGSDHYDRSAFAAVGCFNYVAAMRLDRVIQTLGVSSTKDLYNSIPPSAFAVPMIGSIALACLGAIFEYEKLGGEMPLESWVAKHRKDAPSGHQILTFTTIKKNEHAREAGERNAERARKRRKTTRRDEAHRIRVDRFIKRRERETTS